MGAGASAEEDEGSSANMPPTHSEPRPGPSSRPPRPESTSGRSLTGTNSQNSWRAAMLSASLAQSTGRKMRAAALGRKSACTVQIAKGGFSLQHIQICEGQVITFQWEDFEGKGFNVTQVFHDGEQYKPVVGGYNSGPLQLKGFFEQQFNMRGEFKFVSAGLRVTPLTVEVFERKDIKCNVSDAGFEPKIIRVDEGNFVHWSWAQCSVPRSVIEMKYSHKSGTLVQKESQQRALVTKAGNSRKEFNKPGLFYFQTEGAHPGEMYTCLVHVRERQREFRIEIMDQNFDPPILVIDEGDRVWWHWEKDRCQKLHCVYQIDPPELNHPLDESFKPKKHGFRYPAPSRAGLLSMEFFEPGIYYYSDHNFEEAAEYIGTVIVKPKQVEHFVELTAEGFNPDLVYAKAGDRLWWTWFADEVDHMFQITEVEKCVSPIASRPAIENESQGEGSYMDDELEQLKVACGLETAQLGSVGVYHFRVSDSPNNISTCSVISNGGPRNHTVHITDKGFEPKVVTIHPGDRVWWVWQESKKQHNVIQVSHQGNHIADGFCSGAPVDSPCAFMHQFDLLGVFYYISDSLNKAFGAVVVASQPVVHEVQVTGGAICPDPLPISVNDVVAWTFRGLRQSDVQEITSVDKVLDAQHNSPTVAPRRCMNRLFTEKGVHHFASKSFVKSSRRDRGDDLRVSSVLVDEINDSAVVRVNNHGFHPEKLTISKGQSVLWQWKEPGSEEAHNIIHVNPPNSDAPLSVIQGTRSFNSGRPTPQNSFLYTFDDPGTYCVASQGSPGYAGTVCVIEEENKAALPYISSDFKEGSVDKFHQVLLAVDTHQANIYYTLDGSIPAPFKATSKSQTQQNHVNKSTKVYDPSKGVVLKRSGLGFIRALAVAENKTNSGVYTSGRFWVLSGDEDRSESEHEPEPAVEDNSARWHWWNCVPTIKAVFTQPGVMEVFWDSPPSASKHMIKAYQLFLNGVSYCELFPPIYTSVNVAGLAGGRLYEVLLEVHPTDKMFLPHKSNKLMMKCVQTTSSGGPVISLERAAKPDTLSIVWMSISTEHNPIEGYKVYMNGQMCGNQVVPDSTSDRCKVVIEGCQMDFVYRIVVAAVPSDGSSHKMSNELEVTLPLDVEHITLPPAETRLEDEDLYKEYIEVRESGENKKHKKRQPKTAVVAVKEEAHLSAAPDPPAQPPGPAAEATPVVSQNDSSQLPAPMVSAVSQDDAVLITWHFKRSPGELYNLLVNVVNIVGPKFQKTVNSDISFECMQEVDGEAVAGIQHCWNVTTGNQCVVRGLEAGLEYSIYVVANYALANARQPTEIQAKSAAIKYATIGPPGSVKLRVKEADLSEVTLQWSTPSSHSDVKILGYQVTVDGSPLGKPLPPNITQTSIDNLQAGKSIMVAVTTLSEHPIGNSQPSNSIRVTAPSPPDAPYISEQPSHKKNAVIVAWQKPEASEHAPYGEDIVAYRVFLDGKWHGEVKATAAANRNGYQYYITELEPGQTYDVCVRSYAGQSKVDPHSQQAFCVTEGPVSNTIPIACAAPPKSPILRVEGMNSEGISVHWELPQQYGEAAVSGFQMLKDGNLYGSIIPPDVHTLCIKGLSLGDVTELQILALTEHPVGRGAETVAPNKELDELFNGEHYAGCKPGPKLRVHYTGLVQAPTRVWCENITGHSAVIVWSKDDRLSQHYIAPESYQVTWWPGNKADSEISSQSTKEDHMLITALKPNTKYTVVVEARKMQHYAEVDRQGAPPSEHDGYHNTCILTGACEAITLQTARPPDPATNLSIVGTTCQSIQINWDQPKEHGCEVIGIRVDAVPMKESEEEGGAKHCCAETVPDAAGAIIDNLKEKTEYLITITAITDEFFENLQPGHQLKSSRVLPRDQVPPESEWLPCASIIGMTSGTDGPTDVRVVKTSIDSVTLTWKNPKVHGSNIKRGTVLRWAECRLGQAGFTTPSSNMAHHKNLEGDVNQAVIEGLHPGILYKFCVEAVVSVKTTLQSGHHDPDFEMKNRRTTHVMSKPVFVRTRAPCEPPLPWVTGYTSNTCKMHWEKPLLYRTFGKDDDGNTKYLKLSLEGYRLEINGKPHMRLAPTAQSCTLIKCKPGKTYRIVLVALTCTEEVKRERKRKGCDSQLLQESSFSMTDGANREWQTISDDFENDEAASKALVVTLPKLQDGFLKEKSVVYVEPKVKLNREDEEKDIGDIAVKWQIQGTHDQIKQFNVSWKNLKDKDVQTKVLDAGVTKCTLPVTSRKTLYDIVVEAQFEDEVVAPFVEHVQCLVPGPPDNPVIWLRAIESNEFVIEWAEPRLYGFKCAGYQIYLNGKKVGNSLNSHHRKAVVPCKAKRHYKVNLRALSANERYPDSDLSNSLQVSTGNHPLHMNFIGNEEDLTAYGDDESELVLKIVRITEAAIHLDWSQYTEIPGMTYYRVVWSSVAQPAEREVKLPAGEKSCVIHKCFPGTNHFVRVYSMQAEDRVLDRSRLTTIQTSAPPDPPNVTQRACNFKYVAIEWQKPATYGDAGVTGYKVIVNGVVDATLGPDQCTYSFAGGNWCKEYAFQVQALTATDRLCSRPSDPLVVSWPGVQPPLLFKAPPVSSNSMKVKWETPPATEGVKIKQYKLIVMEEETERPIQIIAPIHPDSTEAEIHNLKAGSYLAYLEVHVHGSSEVVKSDVLRLQPTISPDAPVITVTVVGLDERRAIEKVTANLINKRDWLLSFLSGRENSSPTHHDEHQYTTMKEKLQAVDAMLDDCLEALSQYTGHLLAHVSWTCVQSNPDLVVSGYKVLVDGKQYGTTLHPNVKNIRLKLGLSQPIHQISMVAVSSDKPHASSSLESNVVEVFTEPFRPYSFYTFLSQCPRAGKGMGPAYQEALAIERKTCQMVNLGLLKHPVSPVPAATLMDIFEGEYRPLFPPSGPRAPAMLLFWGQWCHSSRKLISWFVKFARMNASNFEFVAVHCSKTQVTMSERLELVNLITANGWREDKCVRHVTNHSLNQSHLQRQSPGHDCFSYLRGPPVRPGSVGIDARGDKAHNSEKLSSTDVAELLHVPGVPSTLVVHPNDYVAWKGRYAAFDFAAYEHAMKYIAAQVLGQSAPLPDPWDVNIDDVSMSKQITNRPLSNSSPAAMIHLNGTTRPNSSRRPLSAKQQRLFVKTNKHRTGGAGGASGGEKKISVSTRPYSAPKFSPYMEKVSSPHHRRASSGKKNKPLSSS